MVQSKGLIEFLSHCSGNTLLNWDQYISGAVWAYRNTSHSSTGEKPSFYYLVLIVFLQLSHQLEPSHLCRATDVGDY